MSNVRNLRGLLLSAAIMIAVFCVGSAPAWAQTQIPIIVDENGHGTINGFTGLQTLTFSIIPDPGPGGKPNVLAYNLINPPNLVAGDVLLSENIDVSSDLLRFDPNTGGGTLFFYSDQDGGIDSIADIGLPTGRNTNLVTLPEVAIAQGFGAIYTPTAGQPGFVAGAAVPVTYTFISDTNLPEPGSFLLVLPAAALVVLYRRRTRNTARGGLSV